MVRCSQPTMIVRAEEARAWAHATIVGPGQPDAQLF
jgi:hypothetical protein